MDQSREKALKVSGWLLGKWWATGHRLIWTVFFALHQAVSPMSQPSKWPWTQSSSHYHRHTPFLNTWAELDLDADLPIDPLNFSFHPSPSDWCALIQVKPSTWDTKDKHRDWKVVVDYAGKLPYLLFLMLYHDFRTLSGKSHSTVLHCNTVFCTAFQHKFFPPFLMSGPVQIPLRGWSVLHIVCH